MTVNIRFDGDVTLEDDEAWPEGAPEEPPTALAFALMMERDGSKMNTLVDYCLSPEIKVYVAIGDGDEVEVWPRSGRPAATEGEEGVRSDGDV